LKWAGRQGVFTAVSRNPNKDGHFQHNSHDVSELAFSGSFVGSACLLLSSPIASEMRLAMTLAAKDFPSFLGREPWGALKDALLAVDVDQAHGE
jgi:hypothetical protein